MYGVTAPFAAAVAEATGTKPIALKTPRVAKPAPQASFAARWVGKEAVFKALGVSSKGAAAPMKEIEILPDSAGAPIVTLHGDAKAAADAKGISKVHISLSHSEVCIVSLTDHA